MTSIMQSLEAPEPTESVENLVLHQFHYSHYNEKVRWALDLKEVRHRRITHLPGHHLRAIRRLSGQSQTPVMLFGEAVVAGSRAILRELERRWPQPTLLPVDARQRARADELVAHFDDHVGPLVRRSMFSELIQLRRYTCDMFARDRSPVVRLLYRSVFPVVRPLMAKSMGITGPDSIAEANRTIEQAFELVARESGESGYLVGDRFTVADLTAAALLAPAANPRDSPMARPTPMPARVSRWLEKWAELPGCRWVQETYRRHRPTAAVGSRVGEPPPS
jgi:glutathione S-transferase